MKLIPATLPSVPVGSSPAGVVVGQDGIKVYVANSGENTVSVILVPGG